MDGYQFFEYHEIDLQDKIKKLRWFKIEYDNISVLDPYLIFSKYLSRLLKIGIDPCDVAYENC